LLGGSEENIVAGHDPIPLTEQAQADTPTRMSRLRFGLRFVLVLVAVIAVILGAEAARQRRAAELERAELQRRREADMDQIRLDLQCEAALSKNIRDWEDMARPAFKRARRPDARQYDEEVASRWSDSIGKIRTQLAAVEQNRRARQRRWGGN
jgi:hypothetical protein